MTSIPCSTASMVTELMTPLIPGAGPPPTNNANLPGIGGGVIDLSLAHKTGRKTLYAFFRQCIECLARSQSSAYTFNPWEQGPDAWPPNRDILGWCRTSRSDRAGLCPPQGPGS